MRYKIKALGIFCILCFMVLTVNSYSTSAIVLDRDDDGLSYAEEIDIGTDPTDPDTDDDGLLDRYENENPHLNPLRKDIQIEVKYVNGTTPPNNFSRIETVFKNSPIRNPDGTTGVNVHINIASKPVERNGTQNSTYYKSGTYKDDFDNVGEEYFHTLIVDSINNSFLLGKAVFNPDGILIKESTTKCRFEHALTHELGHQIGLRDFEGIDSNSYNYDNYTSVMNYNRGGEGLNGCQNSIDYSSGVGQDDWAKINKSISDSVSAEGG